MTRGDVAPDSGCDMPNISAPEQPNHKLGITPDMRHVWTIDVCRRRLLRTGLIVLPLVAVGRVFGLVHRDMFGYRRLA